MPAIPLTAVKPDAAPDQTGAAAGFAVPAGSGVILLVLVSNGCGQPGGPDRTEVTALRLDLTAPVPSVSRVELSAQLTSLLERVAPAARAPGPGEDGAGRAADARSADDPDGTTTSAGRDPSTRADVDTGPDRPSGPEAAGGPVAAKLSARERQVLGFIAAGCTHEQTAHRMGVRKSTVNTYIERIRVKLGPGNKADLTRAALLLDAVDGPA